MISAVFSRKTTTKLLLYLGVILLGVGTYLYISQAQAAHRAEATAKRAVHLANQGQASPAPATVKPTSQAVDTYTVAPSRPRYLLIPKLRVKARVMAVGVTKRQAIGTPGNVYDTAWYTGSALPGQAGATLIDGHVSSWKTQGVFYNLKSLRAGDRITVQLGNSTLLNYTVVKSEVYDAQAVDVGQLLTPIVSGKSGLNLITCTGDVIRGTNDFSQRVVVYATQT